MAEHRAYGPRDEVDEPIGDRRLIGVSDRGDPRELAEGLCWEARNNTFERGYAETRPGWMTPSWGGKPAISFDPDRDGEEEGIDFPVDFTPMGFGAVLGVGQFSDPNGQEANLIAVRNGVWRVRNFSEPEMIYLPNREKIAGKVRFTQAFDRVFMWRGPDLAPLVWNPSEDFTTGLGEWAAIADSERGDVPFNSSIPNASDALCTQNRLWIPVGKDQLAVSDILDYVHYDQTLSVLRVNSGTDDELVRSVSYAEKAIVVFKRRSGYLLLGTFGESDRLAYTLTSERLPGCLGLVGRDAVAEAGTALFFLSDGGVYEIGQTQENKLHANPAPLSAPIEGTMRRVHWAYAHLAQMQAFQDKLFLAVPLDGATYNNAILVLDLVTKQWQGIWTAPWLRLESWLLVTENGRKKLAFVNGAGGKVRVHWWAELSSEDQQEVAAANLTLDLVGVSDGALLVCGAGKQDFLYGYSSWIEDGILSRGYNLAPLKQERATRLELDLATWNPRFDVTVRRSGRNTEETIADDVRRGFERDLDPESVEARLKAYPIPVYADYATITCDTYAHSGAGFEYVTLPATFEYQRWTVTPEFEDTNKLSERRVMGFYWNVVPSEGSPYLITVSDPVTGQSVSRVVETTYDAETDTYITTGLGVIWLETASFRYPRYGLPLRMLVENMNSAATPICALAAPASVGLKVQVWAKTGIGDVSNSRRQRLFGQPLVRWEDGVAPAEINGRGHDDYAWRVDAGLGSGVVLGAAERHPWAWRLQHRGEFLQVCVATLRGYKALHGIRIHAQEGKRGKGHRPG